MNHQTTGEVKRALMMGGAGFLLFLLALTVVAVFIEFMMFYDHRSTKLSVDLAVEKCIGTGGKPQMDISPSNAILHVICKY